MLPLVGFVLPNAGAVLGVVLSAEADAADEKSIEEPVPTVDRLSRCLFVALRCPVLLETRLGKGSLSFSVLSSLLSWSLAAFDASSTGSASSSVSASPSLSAPGPTASAIRSLVRLLPPKAAGMNALTLGGNRDRIALMRPDPLGSTESLLKKLRVTASPLAKMEVGARGSGLVEGAASLEPRLSPVNATAPEGRGSVKEVE